ncbi:extracellular solute-binding protein [Permianibacter aggregans]|uniref:Putrescine-binding periplasmic protein n=1 Tax=Permianibacter aggregans TaxID=1510150 RepID=A0A4R6UVA6_9GAMM|nr:extracellular solute-binding protein [Permianibacter aggregans]QGX41364.1 extracellular solute-binding protein [Permianibacter aggregans]TDQ51152.1 putrescine transport system substrate-binding protein [Permianibacter aggregans]
MAKQKFALAAAVAAALSLAACSDKPAPEEQAAAPAEEKAAKVVHVYNWSDYIDDSVLADFEKETGIKVVYDVFDSNEVLEAKLLAGSTGFDVVVPSASFLGRQIQAGVFQPLDRTKLSNWGNLDKSIMQRLENYDPGNQYAVPYLWGTTGIGYNVQKVKEILGEDAPVDSWDLVFKPENISKLNKCGVAMLDAQSEILPAALNYLGKDPNSLVEADYTDVAQPLLESIRPHVTYFHSSQYINDLANGDICVAIGWSGDIFQARDRAAEAGKEFEIAYSIPKEGALMFFDMMAVPKDAKNVDEAHQLVNYLMRPEVIAKVTNFVTYANANPASLPMVDEEIKSNKAIYPPEEVMAKLYTQRVMPLEIERVMTRVWTKVSKGQ